jgi:hypothetical protein
MNKKSKQQKKENKKKDLTQILKNFGTRCVPWTLDKEFAEEVGIAYEKRAMGFQWTCSGLGFGEFWFKVENEKIVCENEGMTKKFIKEMLCKMVDDCVLVSD